LKRAFKFSAIERHDSVVLLHSDSMHVKWLIVDIILLGNMTRLMSNFRWLASLKELMNHARVQARPGTVAIHILVNVRGVLDWQQRADEKQQHGLFDYKK
jgi:hypothetical protein